MRDAIYGSSEACDATITLDDTDATELGVRGLYLPSGEEVRGNLVGVATVKLSLAVRRTELAAKGLDDLAQLDGAMVAVHGEEWAIKSWVPMPGSTGEAQGEIRLILTSP